MLAGLILENPGTVATTNREREMIKHLLHTAWLLLMYPTVGLTTPAGWQPLLEPRELAAILASDSGVRIIRVTGNYGRGHLPGSVESPYEDWRGTGRNPGELRSLNEYTALVQKLGIGPDMAVVVVHQGSDPADMGAATRVYWTLKTLGIPDVAVINGGYQAWENAGLAVSKESVSVSPSQFQPTWHDDWRVTTEQVEALVQSGAGTLVDARPLSFFRGLRASLGEPGTIRGAANLEFESWFDGDRLMAREQLAENLEPLDPESQVTVSFCNTGHWASINWFVMSEVLGIQNTRLYAESVATWSEEDRPMDNQVGRLRVYADLTARWWRDLFEGN